MARRDPPDDGRGPPRLPASDEAYVRSRFVRLRDLASRSGISEATLRARQSERLFPRPTYVTDDDEGWYPPTLIPLLRRSARRRLDLRALFLPEFVDALSRLAGKEDRLRARIVRDVSTRHGTPEEVARAYWEGFLTGEYGACLRAPWVPAMIQKERLMQRIDSLTHRPARGSPRWRQELREAVVALDGLEMPFAESDRVRFGGPVTRDRYITQVRARYPEVFATSRAPKTTATAARGRQKRTRRARSRSRTARRSERETSGIR
jgi:predicted DNA-binding transcriptional regulator AlpA